MKRRTRRVNHTRRIRIELQRCAIRVSARDHAVLVSASVDLSGLILEPDAKVFLDVSRKAQSQRLPLGTMGTPTVLVNAETFFDDPAGLRYDIVVVGADDALLLAAARRVRPENSGAEESLLPIRPEDLGERLWRLELDDGHPTLEVNSNSIRWRELADSALFQALVLPEVVGMILTFLAEQGVVEDDDADGPLHSWISFFGGLGVNVEDLSNELDPAARRAVIEQTVDGFARSHNFASSLGPEWAEE